MPHSIMSLKNSPEEVIHFTTHPGNLLAEEICLENQDGGVLIEEICTDDIFLESTLDDKTNVNEIEHIKIENHDLDFIEGNEHSRDWIYVNIESINNDDEDESKIIKRCSLCMQDFPFMLLKNGHQVYGPTSKDPLSKVLVQTLKMSLQLSAVAWQICPNCVHKLQTADIKKNEIEKLTNELSTMKIEFQYITKDLEDMLSSRIDDIRINSSKESLLRDGSIKSSTKDVLLKKCSKPKPERQKRENFSHMDLNFPSPLTHPILKSERMSKIKCPLCKKLLMKKTLRRHVKDMHKKETPIVCSKCMIKIESEKELAVHMLGCHPEDSIEDIIYSHDLETCITKRKKKKKVKWFSPKVTCPVCNIVTTKYYLKYHMNKHDRKYIYKCRHCPEKFMIRTQRRLHMMRVHGAPEPAKKIYECQFCSKSFNWRAGLLQHLKLMHNSNFDFKCEFCDKMFKVKEKYIVHRRQHTDERPFMCKICNHRFRRSAACRKHIKRVHKMEINQLRLNDPTHHELLPMVRLSTNNVIVNGSYYLSPEVQSLQTQQTITSVEAFQEHDQIISNLDPQEIQITTHSYDGQEIQITAEQFKSDDIDASQYEEQEIHIPSNFYV